MEEALLGSMSNTVSISSSGCGSGEKGGGSQDGGTCPLLPPPHIQRSLTLQLGLLLPLNSTHLFSQTDSPAEARGTERLLGCWGDPQNAPFPRAITGGESRFGIGTQG